MTPQQPCYDFPRKRKESCRKCKFFHPDLHYQYAGQCCRYEAKGRSEHAHWYGGKEHPEIPSPDNFWCGDFELWTGTPREEGEPERNNPPEELRMVEAEIAEIQARNRVRKLEDKDPLKADTEKLASLMTKRSEMGGRLK